MALMKCKECANQISDQAENCPHCGAKPKKKISTGKKLVIGFAALVVGLPLVANFFNDKPTAQQAAAPAHSVPPKPDKISDTKAFSICHELIMQTARDPEKSKIPVVKGIENEKEYIFIWDQKSKLLRLRNGLGLEVGVTGYCSLNKKTGALTKLLVDKTEYEAK